jgi:hypothetical protein
MNRGRLRRYVLAVVAAVSVGVGAFVVAGGIANASEVPTTTYGKVLQTSPGGAGQLNAQESTWS